MNKKLITPAEVLAARHSRGHTQTQAANAVGVSLRTWAGWEAGKTRMKNAFMIAYRIARTETPCLGIVNL